LPAGSILTGLFNTAADQPKSLNAVSGTNQHLTDGSVAIVDNHGARFTDQRNGVLLMGAANGPLNLLS
jgi:hypothetical protein